MEKIELTKFINKEISVFVRYGFKKRTEETQSYQGKLISVDEVGVMLKRKISETDYTLVNDFFPWHNIDGIRYRS